MLVNPVIVVPGITASYLDDHYPLPPDTVWSVMTKNYERAGLHPDDIRYEAIEPALVRGGQVFEICYRELIEELRHNLRATEDEPVPVYPFGYDWRQPLDATAAELASFIDEVIARTRLMRHYDADGYGGRPKVNLVVHSMGGLVAMSYLRQHGADKKIGQVVSLATPFKGSFEAVIKMATGTANLGTAAPSSREREAARLTPALYALLPELPDAVSTDGNITKDLFDPAAWQPTVVDTIKEYIRLRGLKPDDREDDARRLFARLLGDAKALRTDLNQLQLADCGLTDSDWLCIVGVDCDTRVALQIDKIDGEPSFAFHDSDRQNGWSKTAAASRRKTGDGTVPYNAALPHFLPLQKIVCVSPDDYGYWEIGDIATTKLAGFHGVLPNMDMLHRLITRFFKKATDSRGNTWGMPPVGVSQANWDPPLNGKLRIRSG